MGCTLDSAAHVKPEPPPARPVRDRPWKAGGSTEREGTDAVRYMSADPATQRPAGGLNDYQPRPLLACLASARWA